MECNGAGVVVRRMSEQDERLAAIVAGLVPEGAVLVARRDDGRWWSLSSELRHTTESAFTAAIFDPGDRRVWGLRESKAVMASDIISAPPPGSIVELMAKRIAGLEDENATLRAILTSVPSPEDEP
jgi:hypothetical protein